MKKVALSLLALALVGTSAFAADSAAGSTPVSPVTASLAANGKAQFGYDLDTKVNGFANAFGSSVTLWFLNGTSEKTGAGDVRGYIKIEDVKLGLDDKASGTNLALAIGDVTAKILFAGDAGYLKLYGKADPKVGYGVDVADGEAAKAYTAKETYYKYAGVYGGDTEWKANSFAGLTSYSNVAAVGGVEVGYTVPSVVALTAAVASGSDWTAATQGAYEAQFVVAQKAVDKLTVEGKFYTGKSTDALNAAGVTVGYDLGILAPFADANLDLSNSKKNFDFGSTFALVDGFKATALAQYTETETVNALATVALADGKLIGPVSANVGFRAFDLTKKVAAELATEIFAKVSLKATDVISVSGSVDTYNTATSKDSSLFVKAGADFTGISLTTLSVNWDSSDLGAAKSTGDSKLGKLVLTAKVAY